MSPHNRVLVLVGGVAIIASLTIAVIFVKTDAAASKLQADEAAAHSLQALGDQLLTEDHEQREALDEYLMSADLLPLARYRKAVTDETQTAGQIRAGAGDLAGVADSLARVAAENDTWRATVADPAIAAVQSGSLEAVKAAIQKEIQDQEATQVAARQFVLKIDAVEAELGVRSNALNGLRVAATAFGLAIELLAAGLSLWFVRRYGLRVSRDTRRRVQASAERVEIIASLRTLRTQGTPEATAALIADALHRLPGVDVAGVLECTANGLLTLATVGPPGSPVQTGEALPDNQARYLLERSRDGPWAERWSPPADPGADDGRRAALGIKSRAFAPIQVDGELVGLIAVATTDEDHGRHLVEDLPAVGEFASVAEAILAPALVARRARAEERRRIAATIASAAFRPVFQPIVDLSTGTTVGFEALTRFDDGCRPDLRFAGAVECGMAIELETATLDAALREARRLAPGAWLSLNVSPAFLVQSGTLGRLLADRPGPVVLEVTEHEAIEAYAPLRAAMLGLGPGVRLAADDAGAGVANFNHLVELRPNFVKIDASLVHGVDADPSRRAVVVGLVHFAAEAGCQVIAEGIETQAERTTVTELGVTLGQGYLLGKPAPAETWHVATQQGDTPVQSLPHVVRPPSARSERSADDGPGAEPVNRRQADRRGPRGRQSGTPLAERPRTRPRVP